MMTPKMLFNFVVVFTIGTYALPNLWLYKSLDHSLIKGDCLVPEDIHTHQMRDIGNSKGEMGVGCQKSKFIKESMK